MKPFPPKQFPKLTLSSFREKEGTAEVKKLVNSSQNKVSFSTNTRHLTGQSFLIDTFSSEDNDTIEPTCLPYKRALLTSPDSALSGFALLWAAVSQAMKMEDGSFECISDTMSDQSIVHSTPKNSSLELIPDSHSGHKGNSKFERNQEMSPLSSRAPYTPRSQDRVIVSETPESESSPCPNKSSASSDLIYSNTIVASPTIAVSKAERNGYDEMEKALPRESFLPNKIKLRGTRQEIIDPSVSPSHIQPSTSHKKSNFSVGPTVISQTPSRLLRKLYRRSGGKDMLQNRLKSRLKAPTLIGKRSLRNLPSGTHAEKPSHSPSVPQSIAPPKTLEVVHLPANPPDKSVNALSEQNEEFQEPSLSDKPWIDSSSFRKPGRPSPPKQEGNNEPMDKEDAMQFQVELQYTFSQDHDTSVSELAEDLDRYQAVSAGNVSSGGVTPQPKASSQQVKRECVPLESKFLFNSQPHAKSSESSSLENAIVHRKSPPSASASASTLKLTEIPIPILPSQSGSFDSGQASSVSKLEGNLLKRGKSRSKISANPKLPPSEKECSPHASFESSFNTPTGHTIDFIPPCPSSINPSQKAKELNPLDTSHPAIPSASSQPVPSQSENPSSPTPEDSSSRKCSTESSFDHDTSSASWLATAEPLGNLPGSAKSNPPQSKPGNNVKGKHTTISADIVYSSQNSQGSPLVSKVQDSEQRDCFARPQSPSRSTPKAPHAVRPKEVVPDSCDIVGDETLRMLPSLNPASRKSSVKRCREDEEGPARPSKRGKPEDPEKIPTCDESVAAHDEDECSVESNHATRGPCSITARITSRGSALITPSPTQIPKADTNIVTEVAGTQFLATPPSSTPAAVKLDGPASCLEPPTPHGQPSKESYSRKCTIKSRDSLPESSCSDSRQPTTEKDKRVGRRAKSKDASFERFSSSSSSEDPQLPASYQADERVWAKWEGDSHYYSATVVAAEATARYKVKFDDGDEGSCEISCLRPLLLLKNTTIFAVKTKRHMFEARVISSKPKEHYEIEFVDSSHERRIVQSKEIILDEHMLACLDQKVDRWEEHRVLLCKQPTENVNSYVSEDKQGVKEELFKGLGFLITNIRTNNSEERKCGGEESIEGKFVDDFERSKISVLIKKHGGVIISDFSDVYSGRDRNPNPKVAGDVKKVFVIASSSKRTKKYLMALALGVPRVSSVWVAECARQNKLLNHQGYQLCNGWSRELNAFASSISSDQNDGLFNQMTMYINGSNTFRSDWESTLEAGGASILTKKTLTNPSVNLAKPILCDYVISEKAPTSKFLETVRRRLRCANYLNSPDDEQDIYPKLVTAEWAVQCLVNQRLTGWNRHEAYTKWDHPK
ncbi:hypothetical protein K493DRAFT_345642 [Basidiobolus meristosporus CBS 931.73]|uniref:BRCT domain-containing protein n=1 Tax=Basidiobolus meristosporus CBS 931.73 TaxID=1314790 RepID=A0A1Y1Z3A8_9FUNG|nr:hypothetical protein K493DRAFT_345642 [Basidiobolus meristosporus CBS 931.73]|eukprot:ORY04427.1 hypothetical protein K493DRAFT_345642 [Basidiobolus meristosporus CBS 931.73]